MTSTSKTTSTGGRGHGSGAAAPPVAARYSRRTQRAIVAGALALVSATGGIVVAQTAEAAVPSFPNNVVVFPDRDFVTVEGYEDHAGQTATVEVWRGTQIVGSAQGVVSGGEVAFEVNHPGGYCWGAGTGLKVTPDIQPNDRVSIRFGTAADATNDDSTVVADAMVTAKSELAADGTTLTVTGKIDPSLATARTEQRIVNPALVDLVGKRDVRAVPGTLTAGPGGAYSSVLEFPTAGTFKATYQFVDPAAAKEAATGGGERFMYWQVEDPAANRQGLTIAEFGELGGPGMGGCPAGPLDSAPPAGSAQVIFGSTSTSAQVSWTPTDALPDASPVTGYSVVAVDKSATPNTQTGVRTDKATSQATISGLTAGKSYTFEVRSMAEDGTFSKPFSIGTSTGATGTQPSTVAANLTLDPAPGDTAATAKGTGLVTATGDSGGQIWYTDDGKQAVVGDSLAPTAKLYKAPIAVTAPVQLSFAYFNKDGNVDQEAGYYAPGQSQTTLAAPANVSQSGVQQDRVTLAWDAVAGAAGYQVEVSPALASAIPATTGTQQTITGLAPSTTYTFTVKTKNAEGVLGAASKAVTVTTSQAADRITVSSARYKTGDFRVAGTGSVDGNTVTLYAVKADGSRGDQIGAPVQVALNAYEFRIRTNVPNPGRVMVESSGKGVSAPFTVTTK